MTDRVDDILGVVCPSLRICPLSGGRWVIYAPDGDPYGWLTTRERAEEIARQDHAWSQCPCGPRVLNLGRP